MDSLRHEANQQILYLYESKENFFRYHQKTDTIPLSADLMKSKARRDSTLRATSQTIPPPLRRYKLLTQLSESTRRTSDSLLQRPAASGEIAQALATARNANSQLVNINSHLVNFRDEFRVHQIQWHKILASAVACMAMFLIGAPLGAIIKKGGLGVPVLVSILFFILFYVLSLLGEKWGKGGAVPVPVGMWLANIVLFACGLGFLGQARRDARLFEGDFYMVMLDRLSKWLPARKRRLHENPAV